MKPPSTLLLLLSILFSLFFIVISAADISPGSTLHASNPNQTWTSPNNTFSLGFIADGSAYFAAITYGGIPVWKAAAAADSSSSLQFLADGNLRLVNGSSGYVIWQSNTAGQGVSSAALDDSGNFILRKGQIPVWSTFDNPTDTILPTQNFTINQELRSGLYSFKLLSTGNLILKWNDSVVYWNLGLQLMNSSISSNTNLTSPNLVIQSIGLLALFDPSLPNPAIMAYSSDYAEGSDILRFLKLESDGNLRIYSSARGSGRSTVRWSALSDQCQVFGYCGNMGICSYNSKLNPICGCPSKNFDPIDPSDSRKGCKWKVEIAECPPANVTMLELEHTTMLTYPPELSSQAFFVPISACRLNCLVSRSCFASTSLSDGSGLGYFKLSPATASGYQSPTVPSTSFVKVCGPVLPNS